MKIYKIIILPCCFSCFSILEYSTADNFQDETLNHLEIKNINNDPICVELAIPAIYKECNKILIEVKNTVSQNEILEKLRELNRLFTKAKEIEKLTIDQKIRDSRGEDLSEYIYKIILHCIVIYNNLPGGKVSASDIIKTN